MNNAQDTKASLYTCLCVEQTISCSLCDGQPFSGHSRLYQYINISDIIVDTSNLNAYRLLVNACGCGRVWTQSNGGVYHGGAALVMASLR